MAVGQEGLVSLGRHRISQAVADYAVGHDREVRRKELEML
jgi:hypothetical protein